MTARTLRWLLLLPLALVLLAIAVGFGGLYWVLDTAGGARWVLAQVADVRPGLVETRSMDGTLRGGLSIHGLVIQDEHYRVLVDQVRARARPGLLPWSITIDALEASGVVVDLMPDEAAPDVELRDRLETLQLPLVLNISHSRIEDVTVNRAATRWLELDAVELAGTWSDRLGDFKGRFEAQTWTGELGGDFSFARPWGLAISGALRWTDALAPSGEVRFELSGDGDAATLALTGPEDGIRIDGEIRSWMDRPEMALQFDGAQAAWLEPVSGITVMGLQARIEGEPEAYAWDLGATLAWPDGEDEVVTASGEGNLEGLLVQKLGLGPGSLELSGTGEFSWTPEPSLGLVLDLSRVAPQRWLPQWPDAHPLQGRVALSWSKEHLAVPEFSLSPAGSSAEIHGGGLVNLQEDTLLFDLTWTGVNWPIASAAPMVASPNGMVRVTGTPDDWELVGGLSVHSGEYPRADLRVQASGDRERLDWQLLKGSFAGGSVAGAGSATWADAFGWQAELVLEDVDSGSFTPQWPARVHAQLALEQKPGADGLLVDIKDAQAMVRGRRLDVSGGVDFTDEGLRFRQLRLSDGVSRAELDGGWLDRDLLAFDLEIRSPGLLAELLGTSLQGRGRLGILGDRPAFEGRLSGEAAQWGDWRIGRYTLEGERAADGPALFVSLDDLFQGDRGLPHAEVSLSGPWEQQVLDAKLVFDETVALDEAVLHAVGRWTQWRDPAALTWAGVMDELELRAAGEPLLRLDEAAPVTLGAREVLLGDACFSSPAGGRLCGQGGYSDAALQISGALQDWPLARLLGPFTPGIDYSQRLGGRLDWSQRSGGKPSGHADLVLTAGMFGPSDDEEARVRTSEGRFGFAMDDGQMHSGELDLAIERQASGNMGHVKVDWGIEDVILDGSGRLSGRARIRSLDLSVLNSLWPEVDRIGGRFDADLALGGRISDPRFEGEFRLAGARFDWATLGVALTDLDLKGAIEASDQVSFEGPFRMGEGQGQVSGQLDFADLADPVWSIQVSGENLEIADLPTLRVNANPDIQLSGRGDQYRIAGELAIPHARIAPNGTILSRVSESEDVVITSGTLPDIAPEPEARPANLGGRLAVRLGKDVRLQMDAVDTALTGEVVLRWPQTLLPTADGQIVVNGEARVFGPALHITNGRVRFNGGPADNPQLNIRAARDVFGNTQVQTAGVLLSGTAQSPNIQAYTDPLTTSERAWGLLITGQDFEYGQGVGAFDIGTYIAPRLYLSYGVSLLDDGSAVSLRYDLRRGFGVKATSSQTENGLDISYTLNRGSTEPRKTGEEAR